MSLKIKNFNWKLFFLLWFMVAASIVCVLPYTLTIQSEQIKLLNVPVTMGQIIAMQLLTNGLLFGLVIGIGLFTANKIGLGLPFLDAFTRGEKTTKPFKPIAWFSILIGIVFGFIIIGLDTWIFNLKKVGLVLPKTVNPPAWQGFLASFLWRNCRGSTPSLILVVTVGLDWQFNDEKQRHASSYSSPLDSQYHYGCYFWFRPSSSHKRDGTPYQFLYYQPSNCPEWNCRLSFWMVILDSWFRKFNDSSF